MINMDRSKIPTALPGAKTSKVATSHPPFAERVKHAVRTATIEVARAVQEASRILKIITFLPSAKDLPSFLKLYGIEDSTACQNPNEM
jgi:hypothetical protein